MEQSCFVLNHKMTRTCPLGGKELGFNAVGPKKGGRPQIRGSRVLR